MVSCVADALASEGKQIGQDILDEVLNIADVLAYCFHKNICKKTEEERADEAIIMGQQYTNVRQNIDTPCNIGDDPVGILAKNQFFRRIESEDNVFVLLCLRELFGIDLGSTGNSPRQLWDGTFNKLKNLWTSRFCNRGNTVSLQGSYFRAGIGESNFKRA